jgi:phospholipase C
MRVVGVLPLFAGLLAGAASAGTLPVFKHIVIVVQENRTPDNIFGSDPSFEPGVDISTTGMAAGRAVPFTATPLAGCFDISHEHLAFMQAWDNGRMDGAYRILTSSHSGCRIPPFPEYKYVINAHREVQPYFDIAKAYGFANRMFQTNQGPSMPAHQFLFAGTSAPSPDTPDFAAENPGVNGPSNCAAPPGQRVAVINPAGQEDALPPVYPCFAHETMADLLDAAGLGWKYYSNTMGTSSIWNAPAAIGVICRAGIQNGMRGCYGPEYIAHVDNRQAQVLTDVGDCRLPAVSWIIPDAADSDHPDANTGGGPSWVAAIVNAIGTQPPCANGESYWKDTAILITWDDWGGWYDHVPPFKVGGQPIGKWGAGYTYGFRVPLLVVSAYTPAGYVDNQTLDFGSLLAFTERNFGLPLLGRHYWADAWAGSLDGFFPLTAPRPFQPIAAPLGAAHFLHTRRSTEGPDND